jgi:hypothetical protein
VIVNSTLVLPKVFGNFNSAVGRIWRSGGSPDECSGRFGVGRGHGSDYCSIAGTVAMTVKKMEARIYFRHFIFMPRFFCLHNGPLYESLELLILTKLEA